MLAMAVSGSTVETYGAFDIHYYDVGEVWDGITNAQVWSATQKADVRAAIDEWDRVINNEPARQIQMHIFWEDFSGNILGGSSSHLLTGTDGAGEQTIWTGSELVWRENLDYGDSWDTYIRYDVDAAGNAWNFGEDTTGDDEFDFRTVITHEIGHSLGWIHSYSATTDTFGYGGYGLTTFESFFVDADGNAPLNGGAGTPDNFDEEGMVFFNGYNATNLYGGLVPIYSPDEYLSGSSLSHLDTGTFPDATMSHAIDLGDSRRTLSDLEIAMMADMGWDVIPEPSTVVVMLLFGSGLLGIRRFFAV
jgi:hypothetical protein